MSSPPPAGGVTATAVAVGLATATGDRVGDDAAVAVAVGAVVGVAVAVRVAVGLAATVAVAAGVAVGTTVGLGLAPVVGDGDAPVVPSVAQARESLTPGAVPHTDRAGVTHEVPSAAVRDSPTMTNG